MKKILSKVAIFAIALTISSCGLSTSNNANNTTHSALGTVASSLLAGAITGNSNTSTGTSLASTGLNLLTSLLGGGQINSNTIVGTWVYSQPQVSFESSNTLAKIGGELVANKIETALSSQLSRIGLKAGVSKFTFDSNGNVTTTINGRSLNGTYTLSGNTLTMTGVLGLAKINCTVTITNNQLYMLFDAKTIFSAISTLGSNVSSISGLLSNFNGMKLGWSLTR